MRVRGERSRSARLEPMWSTSACETNSSSIASTARPIDSSVGRDRLVERLRETGVDEQRALAAGEQVLGHEARPEILLDAMDAGRDLAHAVAFTGGMIRRLHSPSKRRDAACAAPNVE